MGKKGSEVRGVGVGRGLTGVCSEWVSPVVLVVDSVVELVVIG